MQCPRCRDGKLVEIQLRIGDREVVMRSCSRCETRWWGDDAGSRLGLDNVLELAASGRR